jgi:hypothetical protein
VISHASEDAPTIGCAPKKVAYSAASTLDYQKCSGLNIDHSVHNPTTSLCLQPHKPQSSRLDAVSSIKKTAAVPIDDL